MKLPAVDPLVHFISAFIRFLVRFFASVKSGEFFRNLRAWWHADWLFAVFSLIIASTIYYQVKTTISETASVEFIVLTECPEVPEAFIAPDQGRVTVRVRGALKDVRTFETSKRTSIVLKVEKDKAKEGAVVEIKPKHIPGLKGLGLQVVDISPKNVKIKFDGRTPVEFRFADPEFIGTPYHGRVKSFKIEPETVKLRGRTQRLQELSQNVKLSVPAINVQNIVGEVEKVCDVEIPADITRNDYDFLSEEKVTVKIFVEKRESSKLISNLPLRLSLPRPREGETSLPDGYKLEPKSVSATITGYEVSVDALSKSTITAYAYVDDRAALDLTPGATNRVPVRIEVPHDKEISEVIPDPAEVSLIMPPPKPVPVAPAPAPAPELETAANLPEENTVMPAKDEVQSEQTVSEEKPVKENENNEKQ